MNPFEELGFGNELGLIDQLREPLPSDARSRLIAELDKTPVRFYPFHQRWLLINYVAPFHCWSDDGYDSSHSTIPRDIQLLAATGYGVADIYNGGLHQFFGNSTGAFAPEMCEWFERAGFATSSSVLWEAIRKFGDIFPRSKAARKAFLATIRGAERRDWDPFFAMEERFFEYETKEFDAAGDRWLRDVCGIKSLYDTIG